ncbi:MAG: glycosyltransferase family 4 protein [Lentisphaerae bacterium]|nr:glycosyltransferase family 4 protein [Lentisphaerota bacterium]
MEQLAGGGDNSRPPSCTEKVAFSVFRYFPYGGLQLDMMRIARELVSRGKEVVVFCMGYDIDEIPPGISFRKLDVRGLTNHAKARNFEKRLAVELQKEKFGCHVAFNRLTPADWYFAADMPFVESCKRSFLEKLMPRYKVFARMEKDLFSPENTTGILCITTAQMRDFQRIYGTPSERMFLLPPGIDRKFADGLKLRENRADLRRELGIYEDETLLIQVSSAFRTKGVDRSIAAVASLPENIRRKTRLLVVGKGKPAAYIKFANSCGIGSQVFFAGGREDVPELIAAADLMIHPARNEATGTVLLESLACGTPVLCSSNCGFAPMVKESGGVVLPRLFRQKLLNRTLMVTLSTPDKLSDLQRAAENYGRNGDFYRRAACAADLITGQHSDVEV